MTKIWKYLLYGLTAIFIAVQFVPNEVPPNNEELSNDLIQNEEVPEGVRVILKKACYDCHSNQTKYPWYTKIAPSSWLVAKDVREGRDELNFSDWSQLSKRKKIRAMNDVAEEVEKRNMPLEVYKLIHRDAVLTDAEIELIVGWAGEMSNNLLGDK